MAEICENQVSVEQLKPKEFCVACHTSFITRTTPISVPLPVTHPVLNLIPTLRYRFCLFPLGFGLGKHLYSTTLVPGEEIELEVFRSAKVAEELSKQFSVEETFSQELSSTIQSEWSNKQGSNFKIGGGVSASLDLGIFSFGAHVEPEYSTQEETFQKTFSEFVAKSQAKTDRKFDTHIDIKTETISTTRSTRKLRNFNQCQPVTYNYFQLMQRMRQELIIDSLTFDVIAIDQRPLHPVLTAQLGAVLNVARFTPPRSQEILEAVAGTAPAARFAAAAPIPPVSPLVAQATVQHVVIADDFNQPVRQLTLDQLEKIPQDVLQDPAIRQQVLDIAKRLSAQFPVGKAVFSQELCVNTTGEAVECFTGRCLACDTHTALVQEAERDQLRVDLVKAKLERAKSATVFGFVHKMASAVPGVVVRLKKGATVLGETITDNDGLYVLSAKSLADPGDTLTVDVAALPPGLSSVTPTSLNFKPPKEGGAPVQVDFVAT